MNQLLERESQTIAAIATGLSPAGISIIRISGKDAIEIADKLYRGKAQLSQAKSHSLVYGHIYDGDKLIDEVMVGIMLAPRSYTTEDVVEINCHGGLLITREILKLILKKGARLARAGEFTERAFLNGRIDLSQVSAISNIIDAENKLELQAATNVLSGALGNKIKDLRAVVLSEMAFLEAALDDPEHYEYDEHIPLLKQKLTNVIKEINSLIAGFDRGSIIRHGIDTIILGSPNAGKSSLLNALAREEIAIVTDIPGTTRDLVKQSVVIGNLSLNIIDTAGIRDTEDPIEQMGIEKALRAANTAELVLLLIDSTRELDNNHKNLISSMEDKNCIILLNKIDLQSKTDEKALEEITNHRVIAISAKEGKGLDLLEKSIKDLFISSVISSNDDMLISKEGQRVILVDTVNALNRIIDTIESGIPIDMISVDFMEAYELLGQIIGETVSDDLFDEIFSKFCMGK